MCCPEDIQRSCSVYSGSKFVEKERFHQKLFRARTLAKQTCYGDVSIATYIVSTYYRMARR
jgi:hypothetical protein